MRVEVVRRGGIAGIALRGVVDTATLPPDVTAAVEIGLQRLTSHQAGPSRHPDSFQYEITVQDLAADDGAARRIVLDESELPEELRPLVDAAVRQGHPE